MSKKEEGTNPKDLMGKQKDLLSLVPPEGIRGIARAMKYGAYDAKRLDGTKGYGPYNWRNNKVKYSIYLDAILRHTLSLVDSIDYDLDSHLHHLDHIGANVCLLLDALKYDCLVDDRKTKNNLKVYDVPQPESKIYKYNSTKRGIFEGNCGVCSACTYRLDTQAHKLVCQPESPCDED